jgi:hypothetical protein
VYDFLVLQASENQRSTIQIGEAAQLAKLSIDTIRFYERRPYWQEHLAPVDNSASSRQMTYRG